MQLTTSAVGYSCYVKEEAEHQSVGGTSLLSAVELAEEHFRSQESFPLHLDHMAAKIFQFTTKEPWDKGIQTASERLSQSQE